MGSFAEIEEHEATGETAELYADLRETLQLPFVNLIWRHFPTIPGALPAIWGLLKPLYGSRELENCAAELRSVAATTGVETLPPAVWDGAGVNAVHRAEIAEIIKEYNRANSINFLTMATAALVLSGDGEGGDEVGSHQAPSRYRSPKMRPLPSLSALAPGVLTLVEAVDTVGRLGQNNAIASLYRHLSYWPPFLSMAYGSLLPHDRSGAIQDAQRAVVAKGRSLARNRLLPLASSSVPLDPSGRKLALAGIEDFTGLMIGRMSVMGPALLTLLPKATV